MERKTLAVVLGFLLACLVVAPAFAATSSPETRVVNLKILGLNVLTDEDLVRLAQMDISQNPDLFPPVPNFGVTIQPCSAGYPTGGSDLTTGSISLFGKIDDSYAYRFASIGDPASPGNNWVAAVVKPDGTVLRIDQSMGITVEGKSMNSTVCLMVNPEDVILVFVDMTPTGTTAAGPVGAVAGDDDADDAADDDAADDDAADDDAADDDAADDDAADDDAADDDAADDDAADDDAADDDAADDDAADDDAADDDAADDDAADDDAADDDAADDDAADDDAADDDAADDDAADDDAADDDAADDDAADDDDSGHSNNGHGNNTDGHDESNPGHGSGGPNGDNDGSNDDEGHGGGNNPNK